MTQKDPKGQATFSRVYPDPRIMLRAEKTFREHLRKQTMNDALVSSSIEIWGT